MGAADTFDSPRVITQVKKKGAQPIRGTAKSVGGILLRALRGPANHKVRISSPDQYARIFGDYDPNSYGREEVEVALANGTPAVYVVRAVGSSGGSNTNASVTLDTNGPAGYGSLSSGASAFPVALEDGDTFIGKVDNDVGKTATVTITAKPATLTLTGGTYAAGAGGDSIELSVVSQGVTIVRTIDLSSVGNTRQDYIDALNTMPGLSAVASGLGDIDLTTDQSGSGAAAEILSLGGAADVKLGASVVAFSQVGGSNVENVDQVTSAEFAALATAAWGTWSTTTAPTAGKVVWTSKTAGAAPKGVQFTGGTGVSKITGFGTVAHNGSATSSQNSMTFEAVGPGASYDSIAVVVKSEDTRIGAVLAIQADSGTVASVTLSAYGISRIKVGDTLKFADGVVTMRAVVAQIKSRTVLFEAAQTTSGNLTTAGTIVTLETFSLSLVEDGKTIYGPKRGLRTSSLSTESYFVNVVNVPNDDEAIITVTDEGADASTGLDIRPINAVATGDLLTGGDACTVFTDSDWIGSSSDKTGLYAFDTAKDLRLLAVPGVTGTDGAVSKALVDYCNARQDCEALIAPPLGTTPSGALTFKQNNIGENEWGAMHYPWVRTTDPLTGQPTYIPPEGFVMGMIGRTDRDRGIQKAPAGINTGKLLFATGVERELSDDDRNLLYPANINFILHDDTGVYVLGARTLAHNEFEQLHKQRTFIYLRTSLQDGSRWVLQEENVPETWAGLKRQFESFLENEWRNKLLAGKTVDEAFYVIADESVNTPSIVAAQMQKARVGVKVPDTTEWLVIDIENYVAGSTS